MKRSPWFHGLWFSLALAAASVAHAAAPRPSASQQAQSYLVMDGSTMPLAAQSGGVHEGRVVTTKTGSKLSKRLSGAELKPLDITLPFSSVGQSLKNWIQDQIKGKSQSHDVQVVMAGTSGNILWQRSLRAAQLTQVVFPELDGKSKDVAYIELGLQASTIDYQLGGTLKSGQSKTKSKKWLVNGFRVQVSGLPSGHVRKVSKLIWKQPTQSSGSRTSRTSSGPPTISDFDLTITLSDLQPWHEWYQQAVVLGKQSQKRTVEVAWLDPQNSQVGMVTLNGVGIRKLVIDSGSSTQSLTDFRVSLYAEGMSVEFK